MYHRAIPVDVLAVDANPTGDRAVVDPVPYLANGDPAARPRTCAARGGVPVGTVRARSTGASNLRRDAPLPGLLTGLQGVLVREGDARGRGEERQVDVALPGGGCHICPVTDWRAMLDPGDAMPLARYLDGLSARQMAAAARTRGIGQAIDAGTRCAAFLAAVLDDVLDLIGVRSLLAAREGAGHQFLFFMLNDTMCEQMVDVPTGCTVPATAQPLLGPLSVAARDARIVCPHLTVQRDMGRQGEGHTWTC